MTQLIFEYILYVSHSGNMAIFSPEFNTILIDVINNSSHMYTCTCVYIVNKVKRQLDTNYFKWSEHFLPLHKAMSMCITQLSFKFRGSQGKVACGITVNIIQSGNFDIDQPVINMEQIMLTNNLREK